ncbi:hypothetical protein [Microcoleus sp. FACHB-68]|nr:hypothetical protein [Microcoleus sp. FACHB-68]MBD1940680.1 hypothetical protein [Microcoleus sp. FACHB-68]
MSLVDIFINRSLEMGHGAWGMGHGAWGEGKVWGFLLGIQTIISRGFL